jgi:hypothetical protein
MKERIKTFWFLCLIMWFLCSCGGAEPARDTTSAITSPYDTPARTGAGQDREYLVDGEFTTEVDAASVRATAPVSTEFQPDTPDVFFIGRLEGLPSESEVEVRWTRATEGEPFHISRVSASGNYVVLSRFSLAREALPAGSYWVVVMVNGEIGGKRSFRVVDRRDGAMLSVKELKVALSVDDNQRAVDPTNSIPRGVKKVHASFFVNGVEPGAGIRVSWYRDDNLIDEMDIESGGAKRYSAVFEQKKALPIGDYAVEVEVLGNMLARRTFYVGDTSGKPVIDQAGLGTKLGKNRLPSNIKTSFRPGTRSIKCGVQFAFVPDNSKVEVKWVSMANGAEDVLHISEVTIKKGGPSSIGLGWNPGKKLVTGPYKALIAVNDVVYRELPFTVK